MEEMRWTQLDLVNHTKAVNQSSLSRYLASNDLPKVSTLELICRELPEQIRQDLTAAYLTDQIPPSSSDLVSITPRNDGMLEPAPYVVGKAPPGSTLRRDLDILERRAVDDPNLAKALNYLASSLEGAMPSPEYYSSEPENWSLNNDPAVIAARKDLAERERQSRGGGH